MKSDGACCTPTPDARSRVRAIDEDLGVSSGSRLASMLELSGGWFTMGSDKPQVNKGDGESPTRRVRVSPFLIDATAVTNREFAEFTDDTGYITDAERFGGSFVFHQFVKSAMVRSSATQVEQTPWWLYVNGASWRCPEGPGSSNRDRPDHPVVHVSLNDAGCFASWSGVRLPTEREWEYAARGGLEQKTYPWGDHLLTDGGDWQCNIWQGEFPTTNTAEDGYDSTAPVDSFEPNGFGLFNMVGNVWEWCTDPFSSRAPDLDAAPLREVVIRGGSYLCHDSYCNRYRVSARSSNTPTSSTGNLGFRCVADLDRT